jgi:hypothetical protein
MAAMVMRMRLIFSVMLYAHCLSRTGITQTKIVPASYHHSVFGLCAEVCEQPSLSPPTEYASPSLLLAGGKKSPLAKKKNGQFVPLPKHWTMGKVRKRKQNGGKYGIGLP